MFDYLIYTAIGFIGTLLGLEAAQHFTACKIRDKKIKPCMYKEIKLALVTKKQTKAHDDYGENEDRKREAADIEKMN